ncbi:MAG TPA: methyltransferase domain-containing protein, partial [Streptomyces sp.]|nr:methyltransferase domain-containing protein [Streptomyces sp.]
MTRPTVLPAAHWDALYTAGRRYRTVTREETDLLTHHLGPGHHRSALDIACGTGDYTAALHQLGWTPTGIDWAPTAIATARGRHPHL